jgi:hypothetical protein
MKHGRIVEHGTYQDLVARGIDFRVEVAHAQPAGSSPTASASEPDIDNAPAVANDTQASSATPKGPSVSGPLQPHAADGEVLQVAHAAQEKAAAPAESLQQGDLIKVAHAAGARVAASLTSSRVVRVVTRHQARLAEGHSPIAFPAQACDAQTRHVCKFAYHDERQIKVRTQVIVANGRNLAKLTCGRVPWVRCRVGAGVMSQAHDRHRHFAAHKCIPCAATLLS